MELKGLKGQKKARNEHLAVGPQDRIDACRLVAMLVAMRG